MIMGSGMEAVALGSEAFAMGSFFRSTVNFSMYRRGVVFFGG